MPHLTAEDTNSRQARWLIERAPAGCVSSARCGHCAGRRVNERGGGRLDFGRERLQPPGRHVGSARARHRLRLVVGGFREVFGGKGQRQAEGYEHKKQEQRWARLVHTLTPPHKYRLAEIKGVLAEIVSPRIPVPKWNRLLRGSNQNQRVTD